MLNNLDNSYCYSFPAVRGMQAGRSFYIATCPLRIVPKIFIYDEEEVPPELRAQRTLNKNRIPEMVRYLIDNPNDYVFSALTASIASGVQFEEASGTPNLGTLKVPMDAQILINDGQHRRKAIEEAIKENPDLGQDSLPVLFFVDEGLERSQQMFADLNKYAVRPSASLGTLYDLRDSSSEVARHLASNISPFVGTTEFEHSSISKKGNKLFTLSSIKHATRSLLNKGAKDSYNDEELQLAVEFWEEAHKNLVEWQRVLNKELSPSQFRQEYIHAHGIGLHALGVVGSFMFKNNKHDWKDKLQGLRQIDWRKANPMWNNRAMQHGRLSKASTNIQLTATAIKRELGLTISQEELNQEKEYLK